MNKEQEQIPKGLPGTTSNMIQNLPDGTHIQFRGKPGIVDPDSAAAEWEEFGWIKRNGNFYSIELEMKGISNILPDLGGLLTDYQWEEDGSHWINNYEYRVVRTP